MSIASLKGFFKPASRLYTQAGATGTPILYDILNNSYITSSFDGGVKVSTSTETNFSDVIDNGSSFWGAYY